MNNISVTPKGGTVASELSGNQINLTTPSLVKLHLNQSDIKTFTRNGNDLVVTTKSGEVLVIHNFYSPNGDSDLVLEDDRGALWWVEDPGTEGFHYVAIDSTEGLLAENTTSDGTIAAFGIGGAALAGLGAMFAGSSGGGGGNAPVNDGGGNNGGGNNGGGNNGGGNNGGGNNGGGNNGGGNNGGDTTPPSAVTDLQVTDNVGSRQGAIANGAATDDNTPTLSGTAEAGAVISVYDGSTLLGTVVVGADGRWSYTSPALADGQHSLSVTVTDAAGNVSPSTGITITVDTQAPAAATDLALNGNAHGGSIPVLNGSTTDDSTPTLSGHGEAGTVVSVYDGQTLLGTTVVGADGNWSFTTPALTNGNHSLTVTLTDAAGNVSQASSPFNVTVEAGLPPAATSLEIYDNTGSAYVQLNNNANTHDNTPTLTGLAGAGNIITLYNGETVLGSVVAGADGRWSFTPSTLADGTYAFHASATDATGNVTQTPTVTINIDTVPPAAAGDLQLSDDSGSAVQPIAAGGSTHDTTPTLSGTAEAGSTVTIRDGDTVLGTVTVGSNGSWSFTSPELGEGSHSLTTTVTDPAGNVSPASPPITFTVDTTAPDAVSGLVVTDDVGSSQGPLTSGATTDDSTPTLSGSAEAGTVVRIYDGSTLLGSVAVGANGSWSFTTAALSNGPHSLTTTVTDAAGNVSSPSPAFDLNVDAGVPPATSSLVITDDSGSTLVQLTDNAHTHDNTPILSGVAGAGDLITLFNGNVEIGSVVAGSDGQWSFTPTTLPDGSYAFHAVASNAEGQETDSGTITVVIDTNAPEAPSDVQLTDGEGETIIPGSATNTNTPVLSGSGEPGGTVTISDGTTVLGTVTVGSDGSWSYTTPTLSDGNHSLTSTVTDAAGNTGPASPPLTVTVDTQAPTAADNVQLAKDDGTPIVAGGTTNESTPVLSGTAEAGSTVTISDGNTVLGTAIAGSDGSWSYTTPTLGEGNHSLTTTVTDPAGNTSPATTPITVTVDTTPPGAATDLQLSNDQSGTLVPINNALTNDTTPVLSGHAEPGSTVTISDGDTVLGSVAVGSDGNWSFTSPTLQPGDHSLTTTVTDAAGNTGAASEPVTFTVDTTIPAAPGAVQLSNDESGTPVAIATGSATNDSTPVLTGTAAAGSTITVSDGGVVIGTTTVGTDGNWSFTTPALDEGNHSLTATVTSPAGNTSTPSAPIAITVDTTQPAAASDLQLNNDQNGSTQPINAGGTTNDTTPVFSGHAEPGSTVTVSDNGTVLGTVTVGTDGNWSFTPTTPLDAGNHSLTTTVTDPAGNTGPASDPITFTVDTTQPDPAAGLVLSNDNSGTPVAITNGTTNDTTPVLSGTAQAGSTVTVLDGDQVLGTVTVGSDGSWSFTTPSLSQGDHSLTTTVTSPVGNVSEPSAPIAVTVDTQAPSIATELQLSNDAGETPIFIGSGGATNDTTPVLSGRAEPGSTVTVSDGDNVLGTVTVGSDGSWSFTSPALDQGSHSLTTTVSDAAGNSSAPSAPIVFTVDTTPPAAAGDLQLSNDNGGTTIPIASNGVTNDTTPLFSGTAEPGSVVTIRDGDTILGSVAVDSDGNWGFTPSEPLADGSHSLTTTVTDAAGNIGPASDPLDFTVSTTPPAPAADIALNNDEGDTPVPIANNGTTNDSTPVLSGTAEANSTITVSDGSTVLGTAITDAQGNWSFSPTLTDGTHNLSVTVSDAAGNTSAPSSVISVTVDTVAPPAVTGLTLTNDAGTEPVTIPSGGLTNDSTPVLSGNGQAGSIVIVSDQNGVLGSVTVAENGTWRFTPDPALTDGTHNLSVTASDAAGNVSAPTNINVIVDATPPAVPDNITVSNDNGASPVAIGNATNDNTPFLSGRAEAGSIIIIRDGEDVLGSTSVGSNGQWSFSSPTLADGSHSLTVTATDAAGNTSTASTPITFTIDTTVPIPATLVVSNDNGSQPVVVPNGTTTNDNTPLLSGTAAPGSVVTIFDGSVIIGSTTATPEGTWSFSSPALTDGSHTLTATVTDTFGNVSSPSSSFTVAIDVIAPQPASDLLLQNDNGTTPVTIANGGITNDSTPVISGNAEPNGIVTIYDGSTLLGSVVAGSNGSWSYSIPTLTDATHTLNVTVTDAGGNVSSNSSITLTVDTAVPEGVLSFGVYNDAGTTPVQVANDGSSNDTTPLLIGTGVAGTTINIFQDGTLIGTTTVGDDGAWRFETGSLTDGPYVFTVSVTNAAGNTSAEATPITINIDTSVPEAVGNLTVTDDVGDSTGPLTSGASTDDNQPTFAGSAEAGSIVSIYDGNTLLGTATVTNGNWSFTPGTALTNGDHSFTFTVTDAAGNVSETSPAFNLTIAAGLPETSSTLVISDDSGTTSVTLNDGAVTKDTTPVMMGSAGAGDVITIHDGETVLGSVTADAQGQWSFTPTLTDGAHALFITTVDPQGNAGASTPPLTITVDTQAPIAVVNLAAANDQSGVPVPIANNGLTNDSTPLITGTAEANGIVTIYDGNTVIGSTTANAAGAWSFNAPTLSQGGHTLSVTVTDAAGNVGPRSGTVNFTVDSVAPNASTLLVTNDQNSSTVPNGGSTNDSTPTLSGTAEANALVTIYDGGTAIGSTTASATGSWTFTPTTALSDGNHALSVRVSDAAGNVSVASSTTNVVVDTVAPGAVTGLAAVNNNGSTPVAIAAGGSTNDSTPALSGTAEPGSTVIIRDGNQVIGSVTAGSNGAWSFTTPTLGDGPHTLNITATDAAGNVGPNSAITLNVVTATPDPIANLVVSDNVGNTQGALTNGASTDDNTPTLSGTATAGNLVIISEGNTVLGSVVADADGAWTFTTAALSDGSHVLSVAVRDAVGNTSNATNFTVVVDTIAPATSTLVVTNDNTSTPVPNGGTTSDSTPTLSGTAEAGSRITISDNGTVLGTAIAGANGAWTFTPTTALGDGSHPLSVTVTDAAGNTSGSTSATVIIDTTPPVAVTNLVAANNNGSTSVPIAAGGTTNDSTPALSGTAEAGSTVIIRDGTTILGSVVAGSNGAWSFTTPTLGEGAHTLNVTATDAVGNVSPNASLTLTVDTVPPAAVADLLITDDVGAIQGPLTNGAVTDDARPTLSGTAEANAVVTVFDGSTAIGSVVAGANGTWSFTTATLSNGAHSLSVTVKDAAGNVSAATTPVAITVDTVAPTASTLVITNDVSGAPVASGGATNDTTPTLSGVAEAGSTVIIRDGGNILGSVTAGNNGAWSFTSPVLSQGAHTLSVTATDAAGNVSGSTSAAVTIDTTPPAAVTNLVAANNNGSTAVTIPNNGITNDSTPLLTGSGEVGAKISVYDGSVLLGTTTVGSNGSWSFISTTLTNGPHTLNVTATDAAGNVSPNASLTLTVDTIAPAASTPTITDDLGSTPVTLTNGSFTRDTTPTLSGTAEVGAIVTIYDGSTMLGTVTVGSNGSWSFTPSALANGAHVLSTTVTDTAGNISTGNTPTTVTVDTVPPAAVTGLAINTDGTSVSGSGEVGATVTVRDAGGNALGTATVGSNGSWSVTLSSAQTTGAPLSVTQTDRAGNVSGSASLIGAIKVVAVNDTNEVDYSTTQATINNGTPSVSHTALLTVGLGNVLNASLLSSGNAYVFSVGADDTRTITLNGSISSVGLLTNYSLNLYEQQSDGSWLLINTQSNYLGAILSLGTLKGANVTYNNLGTGTYAVIVASTVNISLLPTSTITTVSDFTTMAVTVAATVTGNLLTNDTSSIAGTIPNGTVVASVSGNGVNATGNTVINTTYGTLTIDSHGNYTYTLKAGLDIDTLPAADTFTYAVRDASGALTTATLTVTLHHGAVTSLAAANSLVLENTSAEQHDASGSIYGDSTANHSGTLTIANEHGDVTTVSTLGTTAVVGDFGTLHIAANGNYTYTLNADVNVQSITHKEVFSYTLAGSDGTITTHSFTIELHPTIAGTAGADTLTSSAYDDTITSGAGADTLIYHLLNNAEATGGNGHDTWTDFNVAQGDKIDVSSLLIGWNDSTSNVNDFVKVDHTADGNTVLSIDRDGSGTAYSSTQLITLEGVNVSLEELLQQPHQNHTA